MGLKHAFKKVAKWTGGLMLAFASVVAGDAGIRYLRDPNTVPLTEENQKYAKEYFGEKLDLTKVKIFNHRLSFLQKSDITMVPGGNTIYVPAGIDINKNKRLLIHELTHVYQNQNNIKDTGIIGAFKTWLEHSDYKSSYYYTADTTKTLVAGYNLEQQGDIMAGYAVTRDWLYDLFSRHEAEGESVLQAYFDDTKVQSHLKTYADLRMIISSDVPQKADEWVDHLRLTFDMKKEQYLAMQDTVTNRHYSKKIIFLLDKLSQYETTYDVGGGSPAIAAALHLSSDTDTISIARAIKNVSGALSYEGIYVTQNQQSVLEIMSGSVLLYKPGNWESVLDSAYVSLTDTLAVRPDVDGPSMLQLAPEAVPFAPVKGKTAPIGKNKP